LGIGNVDGGTGNVLPAPPPGTLNDVPVVQSETNDIQADGTIRLMMRDETRNLNGQAMGTYEFMTSDFFKIEGIADGTGRPIHFTTEHRGHELYYHVTLHEPVPNGQNLVLNYEGKATTLVKPAGQPNVFTYHFVHSPNQPCTVRRAEVHRLPPGAELLEKSPADMTETRREGCAR